MKIATHKSEQGVSLLLSMVALMLLTVIAAGMMYMSSTETAIGSNFKAEENAYFAARAGVEEARDRLLSTNANSISGLLPTTLPNTAGGVLYILPSNVTASQVTNVSSSNPLGDDELCHDFPYNGNGYGGMTPYPANVRCTNLPSGSGWYRTTPSKTPYQLDYKWVRVTLKAANSTPYPVDPNQPNATNQVCWNGTSEVLLSGVASCAALTPTANPVYMITALAISPSGATSSGRRLVQQEVALTPPPIPPNDNGMYATGTGCGALSIAGNAQTGSFNSSTQNPPTNPPSNRTNNNGNVGANGNVALGGTSTAVNGAIATTMPPSVGSCPGNGVSKSGNPHYGPINQGSTYYPPVPPLPNPLPPQTNKTYKNTSLAPGAYGNVTFQGTVTLAGGTPSNPAVYTMNSLAFNGNANVQINGTVVINLAGVGQSTVLNMTGGSFANNTYVPSNFTINYGGNGNMVVTGGTAAYAIINAPNAALSFHGGSNFYGQAVAYSIDDQGGTSFYWDQALNVPPPPSQNSAYYEITLRELTY